MDIKIRKKYLFYVLAFGSAVVAAITSGLDTAISNIYIEDSWAFGVAAFLIGILVALILALFLSIKVKGESLGGRFIDPSFDRLRLIDKNELKYHLIAGVGNAVLTAGYFALLSDLGDPSVVLPFTQIVILYLVVFESAIGKGFPTLSEVQSAVIVTFGAILGSLTLTGSIGLEPLVIVFLVINPAWVVFSIYQRKLKLMKFKNKYNDSINIRFWNVVFSCLFTIIFVFFIDMLFGSNHLIAGLTASIVHFKWIFLSMFLTFFSYVFYIRALGIGKASVTQAVRASVIIFAIPVTLFLAHVGISPAFPFDSTLLVIKFIGTTLILLGIASYALTLVKGYVFIKSKPGYPIEETMDKLWKIRGVNRVTATAGPYDFIVKIHVRTLVKGYERVIKNLEKIQGIDSYKWESVLKEWEDI
ncbi:MAG: Lrp/AsnC ligand binding domain-containing protein [Candidatus Thermoplasmatota archaeon]